MFMQVGASYLCAKGSLGANEPVGHRTDMFAAECVRSTTQLLAAKDKTAAATFKLPIDLAKSALSQRIGRQVVFRLPAHSEWLFFTDSVIDGQSLLLSHVVMTSRLPLQRHVHAVFLTALPLAGLNLAF